MSEILSVGLELLLYGLVGYWITYLVLPFFKNSKELEINEELPIAINVDVTYVTGDRPQYYAYRSENSAFIGQAATEGEIMRVIALTYTSGSVVTVSITPEAS